MTTFYLAGTKYAIPAIREIGNALEERGWLWTLDWTAWMENKPENLTLEGIADRELNAVRSANVFIGILPCRFGLFAEMGAALAHYRRVVLYAPDEKWWDTWEDGKSGCIFTRHPKVERIVGDDPVATILEYLA